jgi:hypothetical protein
MDLAAHLVYDTAITLGPTDSVSEVINLLPKRAHSAAIGITRIAGIHRYSRTVLR